ncbi:MAG: hypothetical protein EHM12_09040, partial [Dehalococcoidia bacterium]
MTKKRDPLGKSFSSIIENIQKANGTNLSAFIKPDKNAMHKAQASKNDKIIKGGIIQKTLPVLNADEALKFFKLDKVGQILRKRREDKGFSIADVSQTLCFKKSIIEAIETGNWDKLPHKVYVVGYVRKYASLLGVAEEIAPFMTDTCQEATVDSPGDIKTREREQKQKFHMPRGIFIGMPKISKTAFVYSAIIAVIAGFFIFDMMNKDQTATSKLENAIHVASNITSGEEKQNVPQIT